MNRKELLTIAAFLLLIIAPLSRAEYKPGDRVSVIDAAGVSHVADIVETATNGWYRVAIDGETKNELGPFVFPNANISEAGWLERIGAAFTERSQAVKTYGITIAAAVATWYGSSVKVSSDKDTDQVPRTEAVAMANAAADAAESRALTSGPSVAVRYTLGGSWTSSPRDYAGGFWTPSITFGLPNYDAAGASGAVDNVTKEPPTGGVAQVVLGGTWKQVDEREIEIKGTTDTYSGRAFINGNDAGGYTLNINGAIFTGGTVTAQAMEFEP